MLDADQLRRGREWTFKTSNNADLNGFHEACHEKSEHTRTHTPRAMQIPLIKCASPIKKAFYQARVQR